MHDRYQTDKLGMQPALEKVRPLPLMYTDDRRPAQPVRGDPLCKMRLTQPTLGESRSNHIVCLNRIRLRCTG
jgi:hypothetical protein